MKKFKFKLEALVKLKLAEKQKIEARLGQIVQEMQTHKLQIARDKYQVEVTLDEFNNSLGKGLKSNSISYVPELMKVKRRNISLHKDSLSELEVTRQQVTQELALKDAEIKMLNKMKEKAFAEFQKAYFKKVEDRREEMHRIRDFYLGEKK